MARIRGAHARRAPATARILLGKEPQFRPRTRSARDRLPDSLLERAAANSLWRNALLGRDRALGWKSAEFSRGRTGEPLYSHRNHRSLSPRFGCWAIPRRI